MDKVPKIRQRTWPLCELYGQIFIYHRGGDQPNGHDVPPAFEIPRVPEIDDGRFVHRGSHAVKNVHMHLIEFSENSGDMQHFGPLHGDMLVPWTHKRIPRVKVVHDTSWEPHPEHGHIGVLRDNAVLEIFGRRVERTRASAKIEFIGPGSIALFRFSVPRFGDIIVFQTHLPVAPLEQQVRFTWFAPKSMPRLLVSYIVGSWVSQWSEDIDVWENKIHLRRPVVLPADGPIHRVRRWFSQFYPDAEDKPGAAEPARHASPAQ